MTGADEPAEAPDRVPVARLDRLSATLLPPLWARAHAEVVAPQLGFSDPDAIELLDRFDYGFDEVLTGRRDVIEMVQGTLAVDDVVRDVVARHGVETVVVSAGIGLCTRDRRLGPELPGGVRWIGVDTEEVVHLRSQLLDDDAQLVAASVADARWVDELPLEGRLTLVIAEGVLMYLDDDGLVGFLRACARLPAGSEVVADVVHPRVARSDRHPLVEATGAPFRSGVRDGAALAALVPGLELVDELGVSGRTGATTRAFAAGFRLVTGGGRRHVVVRLRVSPEH